jgi:hypothetical protein
MFRQIKGRLTSYQFRTLTGAEGVRGSVLAERECVLPSAGHLHHGLARQPLDYPRHGNVHRRLIVPALALVVLPP